ncbi:membrane-associated lipoprotein involved in thiamine biosynthesis [Clostridium sp. CAG:413]|nr:membrane-associated lipoprotein involved in thiamine biosynthesis [Clostridium sp. CAG:413]
MKKILIALAVVAAVAAAAIFFASSNEVKREFFAMDTFVSAKVKGFAAKDAAGGISTLVRELDSKQLSRYTSGSEISRINSEAETVLSDEMRDYITELLEVGKMSGGKFDIALGAVSDLWSFNDSPRVPSTDELTEALSRSGSDKLSLSGNTLTRADGCIIDLGSAGKGIALDKVKSYLSDKKISSAVVSVGGSVLLYGKGSFNVGVRDPWGEAGRSVMTVKLGAGCVSTSGSYERCFEQGGKRYHHILDPDTGLPVENGLVSVTVISDSGLLSDALSTACFVLGAEGGAKLAAKYGCEAIFITEDKKVICTDGIKPNVTVLVDGYTVVE